MLRCHQQPKPNVAFLIALQEVYEEVPENEQPGCSVVVDEYEPWESSGPAHQDTYEIPGQDTYEVPEQEQQQETYEIPEQEQGTFEVFSCLLTLRVV